MRHKDPRYMKEIEEFVDAYFANHHRYPSCKTIAEHTTLKKTAVYYYLVAMNKEGILRYDGKSIITRGIEALFPETIRVGLIRSIACCPLSEAEAEISEYIDLPVRLTGEGEFYLLQASGDSMINAGIKENDMVLIRKQETAQDGDIVLVWIEGEGNMLRRLCHENGHMILRSENSHYHDIIGDNCKIQGVALWKLTKFQ